MLGVEGGFADSQKIYVCIYNHDENSKIGYER